MQLNNCLNFFIQIFSGNSNAVQIKRNNLKQPIVTKMFRVYPLGYVHGKKRIICMRAEIYGCKLDFGEPVMLSIPTYLSIYSFQWRNAV